MNIETMEINQCIVIEEATVEDDTFFNREKTLKLIALYKKYKQRLGSSIVKSMKRLWELISKDLSNEYKITIQPSKCENRFRVLERNYKKVVDNNNKTGRGRKLFEFEEEMDDIFKRRKNISPSILLSSSSVVNVPNVQLSVVEASTSGSSSSQSTSSNKENVFKKPQSVRKGYKTRNDILMNLKDDLKSYYARKDRREEEKLQLLKRKVKDSEKRTAKFEEYVDLLKGNTSQLRHQE